MSSVYISLPRNAYCYYKFSYLLFFPLQTYKRIVTVWLRRCYNPVTFTLNQRFLLNLHQITIEIMISQVKILTTNKSGHLIDDEGIMHTPPSNWIFLPAGDAGVTRKVTSQKKYWKVIFKKGRRTMSKGIWAPQSIIDWAKKEMSATRNTEAYKKQRAYSIKRREEQQVNYEHEFCKAVEIFLNFDSKYDVIAKTVAILVTKHAIPVGSGTVARTSMIPIEERASKAVIAWMRHQTTQYDHMHIPKIKGERRSVRRNLAEQSIKVLQNYRKGANIPLNCPLKSVITKTIQ